jgi:hypothetical protein
MSAHASVAFADATALSLRWSTGERDPHRAIIALNLDDDDEDGVPDALASALRPNARDDEQATVTIELDARGPLHVETRGGVRVIDADSAAVEQTDMAPAQRHTVRLVGVTASEHADDARVLFSSGSAAASVSLTVVGVSVLNGENAIVWPHRDAVGVARRITNDDSLPRRFQWAPGSGDRDDVRAEVWDPGASLAPAVIVESVVVQGEGMFHSGFRRSVLRNVPLQGGAPGIPARTTFVRLVGDATDNNAPGVQGQTLLVALRDRVRVSYRRAGVAGEASVDVRVGRPGSEDSPRAARRANWRMIAMRSSAGGPPVLGASDAGASALLREQVQISNEIYLQCYVSFGPPSQASITIADPPAGTLLAVGDDDGLRARGGEVRFRLAGRSVGPIRTRAGWTPLETAEAIGSALRTMGIAARVTSNHRTDYATDGSADIQARDARGRAMVFEPEPLAPLSTDPQQHVELGVVDLHDGLEEFQNMNSASGTLEERTLMKTLMDDDPTTIELIVVNRFTRGTRIGEAFVEGDGGAIINSLFLDRTGIAAQREAWTQSHEIGHILLDQPWHPDNLGPDRPWLLMDADASLAAVNGPKRLTTEECDRIRERSGTASVPAILSAFDSVTLSPRAAEFRAWPTQAPYPRLGRLDPTQRSATEVSVQRPAAATHGITIRLAP